MSSETNPTYDRIEGGFDLCIGAIMLLQVAYTACMMRSLHNLSFMNRLLFLIFVISVACVYAGVILFFTGPDNWKNNDALSYSTLVVNIVFEVSSLLIIWVVGFKFFDSAMKLDTIDAYFEEWLAKVHSKKSRKDEF